MCVCVCGNSGVGSKMKTWLFKRWLELQVFIANTRQDGEQHNHTITSTNDKNTNCLFSKSHAGVYLRLLSIKEIFPHQHQESLSCKAAATAAALRRMFCNNRTKVWLKCSSEGEEWTGEQLWSGSKQQIRQKQQEGEKD